MIELRSKMRALTIALFTLAGAVLSVTGPLSRNDDQLDCDSIVGR